MSADHRHARRAFLSHLRTGAAVAGLTALTPAPDNYFTANRNGYGLSDGDLAVVLVARHSSTPFAYTDAMWAKYGTHLGQRIGFVDPKTKQPPTVNVHRARLDGLIARGVHLAVCQMATRNHANLIAQATGADADGIYKELVGNLVGNAHMAPAGIVAVNRAQERGYSFVVGGWWLVVSGWWLLISSISAMPVGA